MSYLRYDCIPAYPYRGYISYESDAHAASTAASANLANSDAGLAAHDADIAASNAAAAKAA